MSVRARCVRCETPFTLFVPITYSPNEATPHPEDPGNEDHIRACNAIVVPFCEGEERDCREYDRVERCDENRVPVEPRELLNDAPDCGDDAVGDCPDAAAGGRSGVDGLGAGDPGIRVDPDPVRRLIVRAARPDGRQGLEVLWGGVCCSS